MRPLPRITLAAVVLLALAGVALVLYRQWLPQQPPNDRRPRESGLALTVLAAPRPVPSIEFADADGHARTLADFRGKVVLLNFWATWCAPCRSEMPALDRLAAKLGSKYFVVLPVSLDRDGAAAVRPFYKKLGLEKLGIYLDTSGRASAALGLPGVPTTLLIDRKGSEVARKMGAAEWDSPPMIALIGHYLPPDAAFESRPARAAAPAPQSG